MGNVRPPSRRNVGRLVLGGLMVLCIGGVGASFPLAAQALEQARRDAVTRAVGYVDQVVAPVVDGRSSSGHFSSVETEALRSRIARQIDDNELDSIRLWSKSGGFLLFSSDDVGPRIKAPAEVKSAASGSVESSLSGEEDRMLLSTLVPTPAGRDPSAVAQVVQRYTLIVARVKGSWNTIRIGAAAAAALLLGLLLLSRARSTRVDAGDKGFARPSLDRTDRRAEHPASAKLESKLAKAEEARSALEEQLGQLRTQTASAEANHAERAAMFGAQMTEAEARIKELEGLLREAEARASRVAREAPFADAMAERERSGEGYPELERELAETRSELEASRARLQELEPLVALSAASVEDVEARANQGARAADARAKEAEAKADEHARRLQVAETRILELETYIADSERRLAASATAAEESALRIRELQGQLEGARHDGEAALRQSEEARARLEAISVAEESGSSESQNSDRRADRLEERIREMEIHEAQLAEIARSSDERVATAKVEAADAVRAQQALAAKLEQAELALKQREVGDGGPSAESDIHEQLAEAHRAGKEAFRLVGEARAELVETKAELERTRAELDAERARETEPEEVTSSNGRVGQPESATSHDADDPGSTPNGQVPSDQESDQEADQEASAPPEEPIDEERGPSLRFRLAHSAAQRKGKKDRDEMWSSRT